MASIDGAILDFKRLDLLSNGDTPLHRLDARAKVLVTAAFIIAVVSHDRYELAALLPFFLFPAVMIALGNLPCIYILKKIALLCPFVIIVGIFNPLLDRQTMIQLGELQISGGWISFFSIIIRSILTIGAAFVLLGLTGFTSVCRALEKMGMPQAFAVQLMFLYRYIFVLTDEGARASRAREMRSCGKKGYGISSFSSLIGHLLLRTWQRAERIHMAMLARGFTGEFHDSSRSLSARFAICYSVGWISLFIVMRLTDIPRLLGTLFTGGTP